VRILITGAGGLLGGRLSEILSCDHSVTGLIRNRPAPEAVPSLVVDLADAMAVGSALDRTDARAVIHCAALADAEACERDPGRAARENVEATRILAEACGRTRARLLTISTDLVFAGEAPFAVETTEARPLSEYGRTKLHAEETTLAHASDAVVLRVALVLGRGFGSRLSASEGVAQRLRRGEPVTLYEDEWRSPIDPESVASAIRAVLDRPALGGRFHIAGSTRVTRVELGEAVARAFDFDPALIRRAPQSTHRGAPRPRDVSLDITGARRELGFSPRPLELAVREGRSD
jgi:dTDP-4-dehydrorhamnose reductase